MSDAMGTVNPRTKLTPVWLTAAERHLVRSALDVLVEQLQGGTNGGSSSAFARAHTIETIAETSALFHDKAAPNHEEGTT